MPREWARRKALSDQTFFVAVCHTDRCVCYVLRSNRELNIADEFVEQKRERNLFSQFHQKRKFIHVKRGQNDCERQSWTKCT
jgi:hypothetical protein